jgi:hypothetical protein
MRTQQLALAAALTAAVFSANAAQNGMEPVNSPFTWEALGATPTITFGRAAAVKTVDAPKAAVVAPQAEATKATAVVPQAEAPKAAAATVSKTPATTRAASTSSPFTWDAVGATPHVELKKQPAKSEVQAPGTAAQ